MRHSAKRLLELKIEQFGLSKAFDIQQSQIKTPGGGLIIFQGMQNHTADSIKSLESYDVAWIEEAQTISKRSLALLRPTMRKENSEIWASWNPRFESDPIDELLRSDDLPPGAVVVRANYRDNPWLPDTMRDEMLYDRRRDPDKYAHVWLGEYLKNSEARVFKNWRIEEFEAPSDAIHRFGADWGFAQDPTVLVRCHITGRTLFVDFEAYRIGCEIMDTPELFHTIPDADKWPIIADSARPETISHMRKNGFPKIFPAVKGKDSVHEGVEWLKTYDIIVHPRCKHLIDELTLYSYKVDKDTDKILPILEDKKNHCIAKGQIVAALRGNIPIEQITNEDYVLTRQGYKPVISVGITGIDRVIVEIKTTNGNTLLCTHDHKIWTNKGFVKADSLRYGDELISLKKESVWQQNGSSLTGINIGVTQNLKGKAIDDILKQLSRANRDYCTGMYGNITMDRFHPIAIFTTSTATTLIMISQIWNVLLSEIILKNIMMMKDINGKKNILKESGRSQKNGIDQKMDMKRIKKSVQWLTKILFQKRKNVAIAKSIFIQKRLGIEINSALINASPGTEEKQELTTKKDNVLTAEKSLSAINILNRNVVADHVLTVKEIQRKSCVYDMTVKDCHEFFANGILVSNCVDSLRYALEAQRRKHKQSSQNKANPIPTRSYF